MKVPWYGWDNQLPVSQPRFPVCQSLLFCGSVTWVGEKTAIEFPIVTHLYRGHAWAAIGDNPSRVAMAGPDGHSTAAGCCQSCNAQLDDSSTDTCPTCTTTQGNVSKPVSELSSANKAPGTPGPSPHHVPGASHGASTSAHDSDCPADEAVAPTSICLPGCTYGNDARYAIVRCLWCGLPYHKKCVSVDVYTCQSCRLLPQQICTMSQNILDLSRTIQALTDENAIMRDKLDVQTRTISSLESRVSELVSAKSSATASPTPVLDALVIGSSVLRDLDATTLQSTTIDCIRGGKIPDIHQRIKNKTNKYSSVSIIVGGNDCAAAVDASPVDELLHNYKCLVDDAKSLSDDIRVATILPRDDCQETTDRIDALNAGLVEMCASSGLALVNNDDSFKLKDGSINDGYFLRDGTHPTKCGTNRLAKNLKLATKQQYTKDVTRSYVEAAKRIPGVSAGRGGNVAQAREQPRREASQNGSQDAAEPRHDRSTPWVQVGPPRRRYTRHYNATSEQDACAFCSETNHRKDSCRHGRHIKCNLCGKLGHKSKHHNDKY